MAMLSIHQLIFDTLDLPEEEALSIIGGGEIESRRKRLLLFLEKNEWNEDNFKKWIITYNIEKAKKDKQSEKEWDVTQKSRGLGDTIAKITHYTGIAKAVKIKEKITGKPCGCANRQKKLNQKVSYGN